MDVIAYLLPAALILGLAGLASFVWALRAGQFDDLDGAAHRILIDDVAESETRPEGRPSQGRD